MLGLSQDRHLKAAFRRDDLHVMKTLRDLIMSDDGYHTILDLKTSRYYAEWLLNLVDKVRPLRLSMIRGP